jgi:hypothetical protein
MKIEEKDMAYPWRASRVPGDPTRSRARPVRARWVLIEVGFRRMFWLCPPAAVGAERAGRLSRPPVAAGRRVR